MRVAVAALLYVALPLALAAEGTDCTLEDQEFDWTFPPADTARDFLRSRTGPSSCQCRREALLVYDSVRRTLSTNSAPSVMIGKAGANEFSAIVSYFNKKSISPSPAMFYEAGVFPLTPYHLEIFARVYTESIKTFDFAVRWQLPMKQLSADHFYEGVKHQLQSLEAQWPWFWNRPFSELFDNKSVLVVSPFARYIIEQYNRSRGCIFRDKKVLPLFSSLQTVESPLPRFNVSVSDAKDESKASALFDNSTWSSNLLDLQKKVGNVSFDVAIIGVGAYGAPLGAFIKKRMAPGKVVLVLGGNVGPLFGIKARRFDSREMYKGYFYNDCWLRMALPEGAEKMEGAAYWRL